MVPNCSRAKDVVCSRSTPTVTTIIMKFKGTEGVRNIVMLKDQEEVPHTEVRKVFISG